MKSLKDLLEEMHQHCMQLEDLVSDVKEQSECYDDVEVDVQNLTFKIQHAIECITPPESEDELSDAYTSQSKLEEIL